MTLDRPMLAIDEILAQARPVEHTIRLCLRGDLQAQWEQLDRDRAVAEKDSDAGSLAGSPAVAIARQMEALREQMEESTVTFTVRALPRRAYQALAAAHPPRRDDKGAVHEDDRQHGIDTTTFWSPLIRACVVAPELTEAQWTRLLDEVLSDRQYEQLASAAVVACRGDVDIPFSPAVSRLIRASGGGSNAPEPSASASNGSTGGSPKPRMRTTHKGG